MELANTGNALLKGEDSGFQESEKGSQVKKNSAKKSFVKATPQALQWSERAGKDKDSANKSEGQAKRNKRKSFARKSFEHKKTLMAENHSCQVRKYGSKNRYEKSVRKNGTRNFEKKFDRGTVHFLRHVNSLRK